jgi:hypothetical protein
MPNQTIVNYLRQNKNQYSQQELKKALLGQGYSSQEVNEAVNIVFKTAAPTAPTAQGSSNFIQTIMQGRSFSDYFAMIKKYVIIIVAVYIIVEVVDFIANSLGLFGLILIPLLMLIHAARWILSGVLGGLIGYKLVKESGENLKVCMVAGGLYGLAYGGTFIVLELIMMIIYFQPLGFVLSLVFLPFQAISYIIGGVILGLVGGAIAGGKFQ